MQTFRAISDRIFSVSLGFLTAGVVVRIFPALNAAALFRIRTGDPILWTALIAVLVITAVVSYYIEHEILE